MGEGDRTGRGRAAIKWLKRALGLAFLAGVVGMIVIAWLPKPVPVDLATATRGPLRVTVDEDGLARVTDRYVVSAPLSGNLARVELNPGDAVEQGQILARIVPLAPPLMDERTRQQQEARVAAATAAQRQARATINRASAALEFSERELARQRSLGERGSAPAAVVDRAELELRTRREEVTSARFGSRVADFELQMAQAALGRISERDGTGEQMEVPCPVDGRVLRVIRSSEGVVQAGTPLLEIGDPSALEIVVDVLTSDAVHIEPGARVSIERWGGDRALEGRVRLVEPSAFTRTSSLGVEEQRVNAIIDLITPHAEWRALGDGYRVEARVVVWEEDDVLRVPGSAVFRSGDGWAVFAVRDAVATLTPVEVGRRNGFQAEISGGLGDGDRVVVHPSDRVSDGVEVTAR